MSRAQATASSTVTVRSAARRRGADRPEDHPIGTGRDRGTGWAGPRPSHHHLCSRAFPVPPVRSRASSCASSSPVSSKSKIRPFSAILSRWVDLDSTGTPRCTHQRSSTWAGVRPTRAAIAPTAGSDRRRPGAQRAVGLKDHAVTLAGIQQRPAERGGIEVHLVDRWHHGGDRRHAVQLSLAEIRDADRAGVSEFTGPLHPRPRPRRPASGPVHHVQVDVVDAEPLEAPLSFRNRILAAGPGTWW